MQGQAGTFELVLSDDSKQEHSRQRPGASKKGRFQVKGGVRAGKVSPCPIADEGTEAQVTS